MAVETITTLTAENQVFYDRTLLERCLPELTLYEDAQKKKIPSGKGTTIEWRKFNSLAAAKDPLTEGVTPSGSSLDITTITKSLSQYGDFVKISDVLEMQAKVTFLRNQRITLPILFTPPNTKKSSIFIPENGELLIDDTLENLYDWKSAGGTGLYFHESLSPNETFQTANTLQRILEP